MKDPRASFAVAHRDFKVRPSSRTALLPFPLLHHTCRRAVHIMNCSPASPCPCLQTKSRQQGMDDGRVSFVGEIKPVPKEEVAAVREVYLQKHPGHFWVSA